MSETILVARLKHLIVIYAKTVGDLEGVDFVKEIEDHSVRFDIFNIIEEANK
jgi:hypothetical protein